MKTYSTIYRGYDELENFIKKNRMLTNKADCKRASF